MNFWRYISKSTLKREAAAASMVWLLYMAGHVIMTNDAVTQIQVLQMFVLPIVAIFGAAFGADWISKQTNIAGPADNGLNEKDDKK